MKLCSTFFSVADQTEWVYYIKAYIKLVILGIDYFAGDFVFEAILLYLVKTYTFA